MPGVVQLLATMGLPHQLCKVLRCFPFAFSGVWCFGFLPCCVFIHLLGPRLPHCGNWCSPHLCPLQPGHCGLLHQQASPYSTCRFVSRGQRLRMFGTLVAASLRRSSCVLPVTQCNLQRLHVHHCTLLTWLLGGRAHVSWFSVEMHWGSSEWGGDVGTSICRTTGLFACHYGPAVGWTCSSHGAHEFGPSSFAFLAQHNRVFAVTELGPIMVVIELSCGIWPIKALCFAIVPFHLSKVLRLPRKSEAGSYEVLTQNHLSKPTDLMLQNATHLRKPVSWPLTSLMNMSLALRLPREMHLCRSSSNVPRLPLFLEMLQNLYVLLTFDKVHNPLRLPCQTTSERPKVVSGRGPSVFNTFDFEICFAPQRRALFHHLNSQGRSENGVFCTFWLWNVLRATRAGNFSSLISPDGSAPAALASLLSDPPEPRIIGKT